MTSDDSHRTLLDNTQYGRRVHQVLDILSTLERRLPDNGIAFSPPKLVLLGSHGSGKSSLIEAITQIPVPCSIEGERCTKCAMEIRLRRGNDGGQWRCSVSVLRKTSSLHGPNELVHFDSTTNRADLELLLLRARLATFNPSSFVSYRLDVEDPPQPGQEDQISEDIIVVNITGAAVELTLIDLPGFMDEEPFLRTVVENMAQRYVSQNDMLNLVVIPAEKLYHVDRQMASKIAREHDHQSNRTIGIFTHADNLEPGTETDWVNEFLIQRPSLIHGSFVTLSLLPFGNGTWDERRHLERLSLELPPWSQNEVNAYCGTERFAAGLGKVLDRLLRERITNIITNLQESIDKVDDQLQTLPHYFGDAPKTKLIAYCENFVKEMTGFLYASPGEVKREIMAELGELKTRLRATRLLFDPQTETDDVTVSEGGNELISFAEIRRIVTAQKGDGLFCGQNDKAIKYFINLSVSRWPEMCLDSFDHIKTQIRQYMESYALQLLKSVNTRLGQQMSEKMVEILEDAVRNTRECLSRIFEQETRQTPFTMHDEKFQQDRLRYANEVREWRRRESLRFEEISSSPRPQLSSRLEATIRPRPQQTRALLTQSDFQATSQQLTSQGPIQHYGDMVPNHRVQLPGQEQNPRSETSEDPFEQVIQIISNVVAYFDLSVDRISENVAMTIITFWRGLGGELKQNMERKLNLTPERVGRLTLDDSDIRGRRKELYRRKSILEEVLGNLRKLESDDVVES